MWYLLAYSGLAGQTGPKHLKAVFANVSDRLTITPLIGLLRGQPKEVVETLTVDEVRKHRRLIGEATDIEQRLGSDDGQDGRAALELAYLSKMIALHTQQTALSTLIDILGYIPDVSGDGLN